MPNRKCYPIRREDYELYSEIGKGCSATVYHANCIPFNEIVAIKIINLERANLDLDTVSREAQTMLLTDHPNLLKSHCSFANGEMLWVVMPFMSAGSCLRVLQTSYNDGFEEPVIATLLREVLKSLEYLHKSGHIHRDVKAGNILIDASAGVKLGDFGVTANLFDSGDRQRARNTFVGTPCWMAPEVMEHTRGYGCKADIWSFGITALELAHGHAPFYKYPPIKVFLMTLQNAPPSLHDEENKKFSKSFGQMVSLCLLKNPSERPSPRQLLKHSFFNKARSNDYLARTILEGLPSLGDRIQSLNVTSGDRNAMNQDESRKEMSESQKKYKIAISGWDFDCLELKVQAEMIQDVECDNSAMASSTFNIGSSSKKPSLSLASGSDSMEHTEVVSDKSTIISDKLGANQRENCSESESGNINITEAFVTENTAISHTCLQRKGSACFFDSLDVSKEESSNRSQFHDGEHCNEASKLAPDSNARPKVAVIEQKGRFKVTSENIDPEKGPAPLPSMGKCHSLQHASTSPSHSHGMTKSPSLQHIHVSAGAGAGTLTSQPGAKSHNSGSSAALPYLLHFLKDSINSRDYILNALKQQSLAGDYSAPAPHSTKISEKPLITLLEAGRDREKELMHLVNELTRFLSADEHHQHKHKPRN